MGKLNRIFKHLEDEMDSETVCCDIAVLTALIVNAVLTAQQLKAVRTCENGHKRRMFDVSAYEAESGRMYASEPERHLLSSQR